MSRGTFLSEPLFTTVAVFGHPAN